MDAQNFTTDSSQYFTTASTMDLLTSTSSSTDSAINMMTTMTSSFATSLRNVTDRNVLIKQLESRRLELLITLLKMANFTFEGALELVSSANSTFRKYQHNAELMMIKEGVTADQVNLISTSQHYDSNYNKNPFELQQPTRAIVTVFFALIVVAAVTGNLLVIITHYMSRQWRKDISIFLINLAVTDILLAVICIPFTMQQVLDFFWLSPTFLCAPILYMQTLSAFASIYTLVIVGIDRLWFVLHPLRLRLTHGMRGRLIIIALWAVLAITCSVQWMITRLRPVELGKTEFFSCQEDLKEYRKAYAIGLFSTSYGLPLVALVFTYGSLACIIWRNKPPGSQLSHQHRQQQITEAKKRLIKSMTIIVVLFAVMWLPLHILNLVHTFYPNHSMFRNPNLFGMEGQIDTINNFRKFYTPCHLLAMSTSCVNPLVYTFFHRSFRQAVLQVLGRDCFGIQKKVFGQSYSGRGNGGSFYRHHQQHPSAVTQNFQLSLRSQTHGGAVGGSVAEASHRANNSIKRPNFPTHVRQSPQNHRPALLLSSSNNNITAATAMLSNEAVASQITLVNTSDKTPIDPASGVEQVELKTFTAASTSPSSPASSSKRAPLCVGDDNEEDVEIEESDEEDISSCEDDDGNEDEIRAIAVLPRLNIKRRRTRKRQKKATVVNGSVHKYVLEQQTSSGSNRVPNARRPSIFAQIKQSVLGVGYTGSGSNLLAFTGSNRRLNANVVSVPVLNSPLSTEVVVMQDGNSTVAPAAEEDDEEVAKMLVADVVEM